MKSILLVICMFFAFSGASQVEWSTGKSFDFGDIEKDTPVTTTFTFKNNSTQPIVVEMVRSTCGCTVPKWSEEPVEPGQTGDIKVVYDAKKNGYFRKRIKVFFVGVRKANKLDVQGDVFEYE